MANMQLEHLRSLWYILIYLGHSLVRLPHFQNSGADGDTQSESTTDFCSSVFSPKDKNRLFFWHHPLPVRSPWLQSCTLQNPLGEEISTGRTQEMEPGRNGKSGQNSTLKSPVALPMGNNFLQPFSAFLQFFSPTFSHRATPCYSVLVQIRPRRCTEKAPEEWPSKVTRPVVALAAPAPHCTVVSCCVMLYPWKLSTIFQHISTVFDKMILDHWLQIVQFQQTRGSNDFRNPTAQESSTSSSIVQHISAPNLHFKASDPQPPHLDLLRRSECFAEPLGEIRMGRNRKTPILYWTNWIQIESNWPYIHGIAWHCLALRGIPCILEPHSNCLGLKRLWASWEFADPPNIQDGIFIERLQGLDCLAIAVFRTIAWSVKNEDKLSHGSRAIFFGAADINIRTSLLLPNRFLWDRRIE